jgi:hypothetical protein
VGVGEGEVRRPGQQRRGGGGLPGVVPQDELLVEDRRVVVAADLDVGAQQRGQDPPVRREVGVIGSPLDPAQGLFGGFPRPWCRSCRRVPGQCGAEVVLLEEHLDPDPAPAGIQQGLGDGFVVELLDRDAQRRLAAAMKSTITASRSSAAPSSVGPTNASILPSANRAMAVSCLGRSAGRRHRRMPGSTVRGLDLAGKTIPATPLPAATRPGGPGGNPKPAGVGKPAATTNSLTAEPSQRNTSPRK